MASFLLPQRENLGRAKGWSESEVRTPIFDAGKAAKTMLRWPSLVGVQRWERERTHSHEVVIGPCC